MRVLLLTEGIYPYQIGGIQKHSFHLIKYCALRGVKVHVVHCAPENEPLIRGEHDHPAFSGMGQDVSFDCLHFPKYSKIPGSYLRAVLRYADEIADHYAEKLDGYDLIYAQGFTSAGIIKRRSGGARPLLLCNLHGYNMFQMPITLKDRWHRLRLRGVAREICMGSDLVASFGGKITESIANEGIDAKKIMELPLGIDSKWLQAHALSCSKPRHFIYVGRNEKLKGIAILNKAIHRLRRSGIPFQCTFVGPHTPHFQGADNIRYLGVIKEEQELMKQLDKADVLICPSFSEGMPTVIMEAMSRGLAIIATDVGAVGELISPAFASLIRAGEVNSLFDSMKAFVALPEDELLVMKQKARARIEAHFLWDDVVDDFTGKISKLIR